MKGTPSLFEPLRLGGLTLANRIAVSPMCQYSAENGAANEWHLQHLGSLSLSGAGLVIVEQTAVEPPGRISHGCLGLYSDANEAALARRCRLLPAGGFGGARHSACPCRPQGFGEAAVGGRRAASPRRPMPGRPPRHPPSRSTIAGRRRKSSTK
jgi:hypothetical protein